MTQGRLTLVHVVRQLRDTRIPMRVQSTGDDYRVWGNGQEYFTDSLEDALQTGLLIGGGIQ